MPLDQYKTQILLLHSEQSTLDTLSSGFSDSYTVHCATSGSEALNTLVDTPINVIVTAQELPGMSGLDALREAKKRSPETIGILLAGDASADIQALVGEEEVFQVVTGNVTSDGLSQLVDNATRQMRLLALAGAANDTVASVDEPAEHIIMETSDNGSTIISDGTNRLPALDPSRMAASQGIGARSVDVLVLTKDEEFLETIKDSSRGAHNVYYANTLAQANDAISKYKIGVAIVDAAMVGDKVEQLTQHLRKGSQRLVSIVAGRRDDGEMLMDLINRGKVYRFLLKPVSPGRARLAIEASVKHHLEAPDAAFKIAGAAAGPAATQAAQSAKPAPRAAANDAAQNSARTKQPEAKPVTAPTQKAEKVAPVAAPIDPPLGSADAPDGGSPIEDGLANAFGQEDTSFTETVTGLISSFTDKLSKDTKPAKNESLVETVAVNPRKPAPQKVDAGDGGSGQLLQNPKLLGIGAAAAVVVIAAMFWVFGGSDDATSDGLSGTSGDTVATTDTGTPIDVDALLESARAARSAGQVFNPEGENAIELFAAALAAEPQNDLIAAELDAVVNIALGTAETGILEGRLDEADAALSRVRAADTNNSRLPFLTAQLSQLQYRANMDIARSAIQTNRLEEAATALAAAREAGNADLTELDSLQVRVDTMRSEQGVDGLLAKAQARLDSGDLLVPVNDNARYYFQQVLAKDPSSTAAIRGIGVISSTLVFDARSEIQRGDFSGAEDILAHVRVFDPNNAEAILASEELAAARSAGRNATPTQRVAQEQAVSSESDAAAERLAELDRQAETDRQAEAQRQAQADADAEDARQAQAEADAEVEAQRQAQADAEVEAQRQAQADAEAEALRQAQADADAEAERLAELDRQAELERQAEADRIAEEERVAAAEQEAAALAVAATVETPSVETVVDNPASKGASSNQKVAAEPASGPEIVAVSSLERTKYVAPKYPRHAQRRGLSGWVDVVFTVSSDGSVRDVSVKDAKPADTFDSAAVKAVEKWEFEPVFVDGQNVEKRAGLRMVFAVE